MVPNNNGFTLIELLVSISIIGFMASVVLATFTNIRVNAKKSALLQSSTQLRNLMGLYYSANGNFGSDTTACNNIYLNSDINNILKKINADAVNNANCAVVGGGQDWAVYFAFPGGAIATGNYFLCVDGRNNLKLNNAGDTIYSGGYIHLGYCQ